MRLPVIFNSNFQIQDQDGVCVADLFKNPNAKKDGPALVEVINKGRVFHGDYIRQEGLPVLIAIGEDEYRHLIDTVSKSLVIPIDSPVVKKQETNGNGHLSESEVETVVQEPENNGLNENCKPRKRKMSKAQRSAVMKEAWRKRREVSG